jgi:roadblock/LC7 domain-containing protein
MSEQQTPSYDPNKKYTWTPEDSFILSGGEFGLVLNALRSVLNTQEAARILIANEANKIVEGALQRAVESGVAKEAQDSE